MALKVELIVNIDFVFSGEDTALGDQPYRYLTVDEMKSLGDDSLPIDVTRDERADNRDSIGQYTFSLITLFSFEFLF
jgi:hypothetical protein